MSFRASARRKRPHPHRAAVLRHSFLCRWLIRSCSSPDTWHELLEALVTAAEDRQWGAVKLLRQLLPVDASNGEQRRNLARVAHAWAAQGNLDFVKWSWGLHMMCPLTSNTISTAATNGHFTLLRWCRENMPDMCPPHELFRVAVRCFNVDMLEWMVARGDEIDCDALHQAERGQWSLQLNAVRPL